MLGARNNDISANVRCSECSAFIKWGHFKHCSQKKSNLALVEGELKIVEDEIVKEAKQCPECSALVGHYQSCPIAVPIVKIEKCGECRVDTLFGHLPTCSKYHKTLNSHVREQPKKFIETVTCFHDCIICRIEDKRNGSWSHVKPQSGKCTLYIQAPCPGHSRDTVKQVSVYEQEVEKLRRASV